MECLRFFGFHDIKEIERMTFYEYELRKRAYELQMIDEEYRIHRLAWVIREVKAEKKSGKKMKPVYMKFKEFFDYEKLIKMIHADTEAGETHTSATSKRILKYMEERGKNNGKL